MKLLYIIYLFVIAVQFGYAQNDKELAQTLCVTYKTIIVTKNDYNHLAPKNDIEKKFKQSQKLASNFQSTLICNNLESLFESVKSLNIEDSFENEMAKIMFQGNTHYANRTLKERIEVINVSNQTYNLIRPFNFYIWTISNESKNINGIKCLKATSSSSEINKVKNTTIIRPITAWFAPSIPFPFGPNGIDGLPGLILEASANGYTFFTATNILFNCETINKINKPKNKKECLYENYPNLLLEEYQNMRSK